jgi:serine/threonine protein kinase
MVDLRPIGINLDILNKYNYEKLMASVTIDGTPFISECPRITGTTNSKFLYTERGINVAITYTHGIHIAKGAYGIVYNAVMSKDEYKTNVVIKLVKFKNVRQITDVINEVIMQYIISSVVVFGESVCPKIYKIFINTEDDMIIGIVMDKINSSFLDKLYELKNYPSYIQLSYICSYLLRLSIIFDKLFELYNFSHRDMKPNNIMCGTNPLDVKLIDFGMACMKYNGINIFTQSYYNTQNSKQGRDLYQLLSYLTHTKENPDLELLHKDSILQLKPLMDLIKIMGITLKNISDMPINTRINPHLKNNRMIFEDAKNLEFSFSKGMIETLNLEKFSTPGRTTLMIPSPNNWGFDKNYSIYLFLESLEYEIDIKEINNGLLLILNELSKNYKFTQYYANIEDQLLKEIVIYTGKTLSDSNSLKYYCMMSYQILTSELLSRAFTHPFVFSIYRFDRTKKLLEIMDKIMSLERIDVTKYKYFTYEFCLSKNIVSEEYPITPAAMTPAAMTGGANKKTYDWYIGLFGDQYYVN